MVFIGEWVVVVIGSWWWWVSGLKMYIYRKWYYYWTSVGGYIRCFSRGVISTSPPLINGVVMRFVCGELTWDVGRYPNFCEVWKWNSPQEIANRRSCFTWNIPPIRPLILDNIRGWGILTGYCRLYLRGNISSGWSEYYQRMK